MDIYELFGPFLDLDVSEYDWLFQDLMVEAPIKGKSPVGRTMCPHNKIKTNCRDCLGKIYCVHDRRKARCKECGGSDYCIHNRRKARCKTCGGRECCIHDRNVYRCKLCKH